jgi:hypothetical protein
MEELTMREEITSFIQRQQHCKLNFIAYPWFVQRFGADVTFLRAWGCAISTMLNSTIILFRDWPFYSVETWWSFLLEIGADIIFFCLFGPVSVLTIGLFTWFLALVVWSLFETSTIFTETRKLEDWQTWEHIQAVLQEKINNTVFVLLESYLIYKTIENWDAWGPSL